MKISYILAAAIVAMLVVPGTASQLAARNAMASPLLPTPLLASTGGLFHDPNTEPKLTITLPAKFTALDVGTYDLQSFQG